MEPRGGMNLSLSVGVFVGVLYLQGVLFRLLLDRDFGVLGQYSTLGGVFGSFDEPNAEAGRFSVRDER